MLSYLGAEIGEMKRVKVRRGSSQPRVNPRHSSQTKLRLDFVFFYSTKFIKTNSLVMDDLFKNIPKKHIGEEIK